MVGLSFDLHLFRDSWDEGTALREVCSMTTKQRIRIKNKAKSLIRRKR